MSKKKQNLGIQIINIKELSFTNKLTENIIRNFNEDKLLMNVGMAVDSDISNETVSLSILVTYLFKEIENKKPAEFISLETETTFKFYNLKQNDRHIKIEENNVFLDDDLILSLFNTAFGATRGMFAYKMASLPINIVIPFIDPKELLENTSSKQENQ